MKAIWTDQRPIAEVWDTLRSRGFDPDRLGLPLDGQARIARRFPAIMDGNGRFIQEAFDFLFEVAFIQGTTTSGRTLETYSESLVSWLLFAEQNGIAWAIPSRSRLAAFRNHMLGTQGNKYREKPLSRRTVNLRLTVALEFYIYLGLIDRPEKRARRYGGPPDHPSVPTATAPTGHRRPTEFERLRVPLYRKRPRALTPEQCRALSDELRNPYRLMWQWMLCTGLRIGSVVRISLASIQAMLATSQPEITIPAKGGRIVSVHVQRPLRDATALYIAVARKLALGRRGQLSEGSLFLNARGTAVTQKGFYRALRRAAARHAIKVHPHRARSTFATYLEDRIEKLQLRTNIKLDPIKIVQHLLHHGSAQTTKDYLESIDVPSHDVLHILDELAATHFTIEDNKCPES